MSNIINLVPNQASKTPTEPTLLATQLPAPLVQRLRAKQKEFHEKRIQQLHLAQKLAKKLIGIVRGAPRVPKGPLAVIGYLGEFGQTDVLCANDEFS